MSQISNFLTRGSYVVPAWTEDCAGKRNKNECTEKGYDEPDSRIGGDICGPCEREEERERDEQQRIGMG